MSRGGGQSPAAARILLVEDQWLIAMDLATGLKNEGYEIVGPARTTSKALELMDVNHIDVGILDINLEGSTSYPVAKALASKGIPFAFLTGHDIDDVRHDFSDRKVLSKPVDPTELLEVLQDLLSNPIA